VGPPASLADHGGLCTIVVGAGRPWQIGDTGQSGRYPAGQSGYGGHPVHRGTDCPGRGLRDRPVRLSGIDARQTGNVVPEEHKISRGICQFYRPVWPDEPAYPVKEFLYASFVGLTGVENQPGRKIINEYSKAFGTAFRSGRPRPPACPGRRLTGSSFCRPDRSLSPVCLAMN
jgi:hypothetical protein